MALKGKKYGKCIFDKMPVFKKVKANHALGRGWFCGKNTHFLVLLYKKFIPHSVRDRVNCGVLGRKGGWDGRKIT